MEQSSSPKDKKKLYRRSLGIWSRLAGVSSAYWSLSAIEFFFWFAAATGGYLTVFLQKNGFQPAQVGVINAINSAVAIAAMPFWGMISDKWRSIRKVFFLCMVIAAVLWAVVPATAKIALGPILLAQLLIPIGSFFRMPANSLVDAFVVQTSAQKNAAYGNVRLWGSIGYAVMALSLSAVLPWTGVEMSFYMYGLAFIPMMVILWRMKGVDTGLSRKKPVPFREMKFGRLFKNYYFITYLTFAIFMHMPMNTSMAFLPYLVDMVGGDTAQLGLVTGYKALLEIPMLLLIKPLRKRFPLPLAIILSCVFYTLEFLFYSGAGSLLEIMLVQTLHGFAGGLMIGSATNYVYSLAPDGLNSTAHTLNGATNSLSAIVGNLLGGVLITTVGIRQFYIIAAALIAISVVYFLLTLFWGAKILKKPLPPLARSERARERLTLNAPQK